MFSSQRIACWFSLFAVLGFGLQGIVSSMGALEIVFPDLPALIPHTAGRSFHVNVSVFWPLMGLIGGIYYFFTLEAGRELYRLDLAKANFYFLAASIFVLLGSLVVGYNEGREYLEGIWPLRAGVLFSLALFIYNLARTYGAAGEFKSRATLISMLAGMWMLVIFYIPTLKTYAHPSLDELAKFLVVHLWEEMCLELVAVGIIGAMLVNMTGVERRKIETILYLDIAIMTAGGVMGTAHHYYWIGTPVSWLWIGLIFSFMQIIPAVLLAYTGATSLSRKIWEGFGHREWLTITLLACSTVYHIFGAGLMGFLMSYPPINKYVHGTYITSAHSHLAVFGVFGFLVLAVSVYILFAEVPLPKVAFRQGMLAVGALNAGLLIMSLGLMVAGGLQTYFWRVLDIGITTTNEMIRPYLIFRVLGGAAYLSGSTLFTYMVLRQLWPYRSSIIAAEAQPVHARELNRHLRDLIAKERQLASIAQRVRVIYKLLTELLKIRNK